MKKKKKLLIDALADTYRDKPVQAPCPHFGQCGGCLFQDIPYERQLDLKREMINRSIAGIGAVDSVNPSEPYRYRGRMDMVTAWGKCGLRRRGSFRNVVDISTCLIMQEKSEGAFRAIRELIADVEGYDYLRHLGYLRYVIVREARFTGRVMANFVVASRDNRLERVLRETEPLVDSLSLILNEGMADTSYGEIIATVKAGHIEEEFDGIRYRLTPNSFFQSNSFIARAMYRAIRERAGGRVLDLCSGVGSISLFVAGNSESVTGVESNRESVDAAGVNRELNGSGNVDFICSDAGEFLRGNGTSYDTIILDPPRTGIGPKLMELIDGRGAATVIYMSCNPATFAADVPALARYSLESLEAYDMFPQTPHVELLAVFRKRPA